VGESGEIVFEETVIDGFEQLPSALNSLFTGDHRGKLLVRADEGRRLLLLVSGGAAADVTYGEHGMALFGGKEGLYASHLPMFHAPHDYQVILVHVADPATDAALRKRLDGKTALWTIAPEKFELSRLAPQAPCRCAVQGRPGAGPFRARRQDTVRGVDHRGRQSAHVPQTVAGAARQQHVNVHANRQRQAALPREANRQPSRLRPHPVLPRSTGATTDNITVIKQDLRQPSPAELATALHTRCDAIKGTIYFYTDDLK
jgi:hypothetical protein